MKKIYASLLILTMCTGCTKNTAEAPVVAPVEQPLPLKTFDVFYDGQEYTGGVNYNSIPAAGALGNSYKNIVTGYQIRDVNFSLAVTNIPDSGIVKMLCTSGCDPKNGDSFLTFTDTEINLSGFSGTVQRVSSGKIVINAAKAGKALVGNLQWK